MLRWTSSVNRGATRLLITSTSSSTGGYVGTVAGGPHPAGYLPKQLPVLGTYTSVERGSTGCAATVINLK
jgi:hypothetical protein